MGIGVSIVLIAVGAVLAFAVEFEVSGLDIAVVGWILMIVWVLGALLSLAALTSWRSRRETVVRADPPREREIIRERDR